MSEWINSFRAKNGLQDGFFNAASAAKSGKLDIGSASEKAFPFFFSDFFGCRNPSKKEVFKYTGMHSLLVDWCCHSVESRALTCPFKNNHQIV